MEQKTTTFTPDSMALIDGEIALLGNKGEVTMGDPILRDGQLTSIGTWHPDWVETIHKDSRKVLATTKIYPSYIKVHHIDRNHFVKPDFDVEELANNKAYEWTTFDQAANAYEKGFKAGYNANNNQFTMEEMERAIEYAFHSARISESTKVISPLKSEIIHSLRPLSIPKSVTVDEQFNVINVRW